LHGREGQDVVGILAPQLEGMLLVRLVISNENSGGDIELSVAWDLRHTNPIEGPAHYVELAADGFSSIGEKQKVYAHMSSS
jgi:hypothetical protein